MEIYGRIYLLTSPSGKCYVGQTVQNFSNYFNKIYKYNKGKGRTAINSAILKYGIENFKVEIVAECYSKDDLDRAEIAFIKTFDTANTGYNIKLGGSSGIPGPNSKMFTEEFRLKRSLLVKTNPEKMRQITNLGKFHEIRFIYKIISPEGIEYITGSVNKHCEEHKIPSYILYRRKYYKGWYIFSKTNIKTNETIILRDPNTWKDKRMIPKFVYKIQSPSMEILETFNLNKFCKENNINESNIHRSGKCKGWTLISKKEAV